MYLHQHLLPFYNQHVVANIQDEAERSQNCSIKEKELFLNFCHENNVFLFFEHDASVELCSVKKTGRGIRLNEKLSLFDL